MYSVTIIDSFSAAHNLRYYEGKCENLHGHNWRVEVTVSADELDPPGMVIDFKILKKMVSDVLAEIDHCYLNELAYFDTINPTSENIARFIYSKISEQLTHERLKVEKVNVWETPTSCATYWRDR